MTKKKTGLPKRIAGVKIPKAVRKAPLAQVLGSKAGKAVLAEALMLAASGLAIGGASKAGGGDPARGGKRALEGAGRGLAALGAEVSDQAANASSTLAHALREGAEAFMQALHRGPPGEDGSWRAEPAPPTPAPPKKKAREYPLAAGPETGPAH